MREINAGEIDRNVFDLIGSDWMLVAAGDERRANAMTASWGGLGVVWGRPAATIYLRPQRYTKEFVDVQSTFSLSFFGEGYRDALKYFGSVSGRDEEKIAKSGLSTAFADGTPYFTEASLVFVCRKAYAQPLEEGCFVDNQALSAWYPQKDFHTLYIGSIEKVLVQD